MVNGDQANAKNEQNTSTIMFREIMSKARLPVWP